MRATIIGLPDSGKTTVFRALTGSVAEAGQEPLLVAVRVPNEHVDIFSKIYKPKKTTYAKVEFVDLGFASDLKKENSQLGQKFLTAVRPAQALVHVIDAFSVPELANEAVEEAISCVETELIIADLEQCEKRIERMEKERIQAGTMQLEHELLKKIAVWLTSGKPLRVNPELNDNELIKSFAFLSGKPVITVVNTSEDNPEWSPSGLPEAVLCDRVGSFGSIISLCGKIEQEIASLGPEDAAAFLEDFGIKSPAGDRVIKECYKLLGSISFFTVGEDEVKAWTIKRGDTAKQAARVIHSDIERGFIRAEVVDCKTSVELGGFEEAKKHGKVRLEGKNYEVQNGDIISFRFNV